MAFYYQEFILALPAAQAVPMMNVIIALDLSGEGAVPTKRSYSGASSGKERGRARDLADFLLANGLLTPAGLDEAGQTVIQNDHSGVCERALQRLQYRPKSS